MGLLRRKRCVGDQQEKTADNANDVDVVRDSRQGEEIWRVPRVSIDDVRSKGDIRAVDSLSG